MKNFNPLKWTAVTWVAVLVWCWGAYPLNYPPSVSYEMDSSGKLLNPTHYSDLSEYPFPVGWPFHYVEPDDPTITMGPILAGTPTPLPGPSNVSIIAMIANSTLILWAIASLIALLQMFMPAKFSLRLLFVLTALYPFYFAGARLVSKLFGYNFVDWYSNGIYFSPILILIAVTCFKFSGRNVDSPAESHAETAG